MKTLYKNLMTLCKEDKSKFFYKDVKVGLDKTARIFNYNFAAYSDWLKPGALESRGIMFEIKGDKPVDILCRPMEKFFNLNELPFTMNLDLSKVDYIMTKADGSLISSYLVDGYVYFKSKNSIESDQVIESTSLLSSPEYTGLRETIKAFPELTFNFEYVSPTNRIVLFYPDPNLILLNARNRLTGEYVPYSELFKHAELRKFLVDRYVINAEEDWVSKIYESKLIEGFVAVMTTGQKFKIKTNWYVSLHKTKESITSNKALFTAVVRGTSDDLRSMFAGDEESVEKINSFETAHMEALSTNMSIIESISNRLRGQDRKTWALESQVNLQKLGHPELFGIVMKCYTGYDYDTVFNDVNELFLKYFEKYVPEKYK